MIRLGSHPTPTKFLKESASIIRLPNMYNMTSLAALAAVCQTGSFEAAARRLHITQSAVSQRLATLEHEIGRAVVQRTRPVAPTAAGEVLLKLARQVELATADATEALAAAGVAGVRSDGTTRLTRCALAVNADSVATWFTTVVGNIARDGTMMLDLRIEDEEVSRESLRRGAVMAAVTSQSAPAPGCVVSPLGAMEYWPVCAPQIADAVAAAPERQPLVRFDMHDSLQHRYLEMVGALHEPPAHFVPSNHDFLAAVRLGLGWSVLPSNQAREEIARGALVRFDTSRSVAVPLYWQRWRIESPILDRVTAWVIRAAAGLRGRPAA